MYWVRSSRRDSSGWLCACDWGWGLVLELENQETIFTWVMYLVEVAGDFRVGRSCLKPPLSLAAAQGHPLDLRTFRSHLTACAEGPEANL